MRDLRSDYNGTVALAFAAKAKSGSPFTSAAIDLNGFEGCMIVATAGALGTEVDTYTVSLTDGATNAAADTPVAGYPVTLVDNMPAMGSANYPVGFGNWQKAFGIVDRYPAFTVQRMAEAFAVYGIIGFLARFRTTSGPLVGEAAHFLQMST